MEKKIIISEEMLLDEYVAITCMGLITCYEQGVLSYERIMLWLFNNKVINFMKNSRGNSPIVTALEYGEELWGGEKTDLFEKTISDIKKFCIDFLSDTETKHIGKEYLRFE